MLNKKAKTESRGAPFLRCLSVLAVTSGKDETPVADNLHNYANHLSGKSRRDLYVRPWCHTVSQATAKSTNSIPTFFAKKLSLYLA